MDVWCSSRIKKKPKSAKKSDRLLRGLQPVLQNQRETVHQEISGIVYRPDHFRHVVNRDRHRDLATLGIDDGHATAQAIERAILAGHGYVPIRPTNCIAR